MKNDTVQVRLYYSKGRRGLTLPAPDIDGADGVQPPGQPGQVEECFQLLWGGHDFIVALKIEFEFVK